MSRNDTLHRMFEKHAHVIDLRVFPSISVPCLFRIKNLSDLRERTHSALGGVISHCL